jgi:ABC-type transport system involved in Fe-S cluster assembly fused permease/ATPase subunit
VHNPGNITSIVANKNLLQQSYLNLSDITVVYEEAFSNWLDKNTFQALQSANRNVKRSKLAVILHSLPNISKKVLDFVVEQVEETADWLYLTDIGVKDEYYHSLSPLFTDLVKAVDS